MRTIDELNDYIDKFWYKYRTVPHIIYVTPDLYFDLSTTSELPTYILWKHHKGTVCIKPRTW